MNELSLNYNLKRGDLTNAALVEKIKRDILNLKLSVNSFIVVCLPQTKNRKIQTVFFQTIRHRSFKRTNYYMYEIQVAVSTTKGTELKMYRAEKQRKKEVLQAFENYCILRIQPDFSKLHDITEEIFGSEKTNKKYESAKQLVSEYLMTLSPTDIQKYRYEEALKFLCRVYRESEYGILLAKVYVEHGMYEKARKLYREMTFKNSATYMLANMICEGKCGKPNYKSAYEYYRHTSLLLDDEYCNMAKIQIARMYLSGKYLKQNYGKYRRIIKILEKEFIQSDAEFDLCLPELYYELALICKNEENAAEALYNCHQAKHYAYELAYNNKDVTSFKNAMRISKLYYTLTEFIPEDMELMDLLYLLEKPAVVTFFCRNAVFDIEAALQNGRILIKFGDRYFNGVIDFLSKAVISGTPICSCKKDIGFLEVIR